MPSLSSHFFSLDIFSSIIRCCFFLYRQWVQPNAHSESHHVQFFFLEQPFLLLPLLQSQKLFNLYLFSLSLLVSLVFCAAHNSTTYKYDGVHSILAINISRVCLSLFAPICYSSSDPSCKREEKKANEWNGIVAWTSHIQCGSSTQYENMME